MSDFDIPFYRKVIKVTQFIQVMMVMMMMKMACRESTTVETKLENFTVDVSLRSSTKNSSVTTQIHLILENMVRLLLINFTPPPKFLRLLFKTGLQSRT